MNQFSKPEIDRSFWKNFHAVIDFYSIKNGLREIHSRNCLVAFVEEKDDKFKYRLHISSREKKEDSYYFPLVAEPKPQLTISPQDRQIIYEFYIEEKFQIQVVFVIKNEDYEDAGQFREILARLLFQTTYKKPSNEADNTDEIFRLITQKNVATYTDKLVKLHKQLNDDKKFEFVGIGRFAQMDPNNANTDPIVILPMGLFAIVAKGNFSYDIIVVDENNDVYHTKALNENLYYYFNDGLNSVTWMDLKGKDIICLNFEFDKTTISGLKVLMSALLMQSVQKQSMEQIIEKEKNSWDQYYLRTDNRIDEEENDEYRKYGDQNAYLDVDADYKYPVKKPGMGGEIRDFVQGVSSHRAFVNRGDIVNVYKYEDDVQNFNYVSDLPSFEYLGDKLTPSKIQLQEQDSKLAFIDNHHLNKIYYYDVEKNKVVNEFQPEKDAKIRDISISGGKNAHLGNDPLILSVGENEIYKLDPRVNKGVVQSKTYKTKIGFEKVLGIMDDNFVVGSQNGDIRFFNTVGGNAKNVIPSMFGDKVIGMDSSKDGNLLLLTFNKYLALMPTLQNGKSAYGTTFRKDSKPRPLILRVDPKILARNNMAEPNFVSAKFDFKKGDKESHIVAACGNILIIWDLVKVLKGNVVARAYVPLEDRIVEGEFVFNQDNLITALPKDITINKARLGAF